MRRGAGREIRGLVSWLLGSWLEIGCNSGAPRLCPPGECLVGAARRDLVVVLGGLRPLLLLLVGKPRPRQRAISERGLYGRLVSRSLERGQGGCGTAELHLALSDQEQAFRPHRVFGALGRHPRQRHGVLEVPLGEGGLRLLQRGAARERGIREFLAETIPRRVRVFLTGEPGRHGARIVERFGGRGLLGHERVVLLCDVLLLPGLELAVERGEPTTSTRDSDTSARRHGAPTCLPPCCPRRSLLAPGSSGIPEPACGRDISLGSLRGWSPPRRDAWSR